MSPIIITKANGEQEPFDSAKLENSLLRAGAKAEVVDDILSSIEQELRPGMTTREIYQHAFELLGKKNRPVAIRYSLRRAIMDLGPSGFPFEKLIAEIFKTKGFQTETDRRITGKCVQHEIDVIAYNETDLYLIEAKFHNQLGVKTDTKVALYVKARYDDLAGVDIRISGENRQMTRGWLITNTKFTQSAIEYGQCQNLNFVGWNYPSKGNLHDMITESGLHPLTCLTVTSQAEERTLLEKGVVLLRQLVDDSSVLDALGMPESKKEEVIAEAKSVLNG